MISFILSVVVSIASFGAVSNNESVNNAEAINRAIEHCAEQGGGRVVVPCGEYTTGSVYLKSGVTLFLEQGAVLKGVHDINAYASLQTTLDLSRYVSGQGTVNYNSATDSQWSKAMVFAVGVSDAGIEGKGCIDGADVRNPLGEEHMRGPHTILMAGCKRMTFDGFSVKRSAKGGADATQPACRSHLARRGITPRSAIFTGNVCSRTPTDKGNHKGSERRARKGSKPTRIPTRVVQDGNRQRVDGPGRHAIRKVEPENDEGRLQADPKNRERWQGFDPSPPLCLIFFRHGVSPVDVWARFAPHISTRG